MIDDCEYHYAPGPGYIMCVKLGVEENAGSWAEHNAILVRFLDLRASGRIVLKETINYGHSMFHGHSGKVDIYRPALTK